MITTHTPEIRYSQRARISEGSCKSTPQVRSKFSPVLHFLRAATLNTRQLPPQISTTSRAAPRFNPSPHKAPAKISLSNRVAKWSPRVL